jgi:hypothetical protein
MPTIIDGTTGVDQIQDGTVTEAKIADGAVTAAKLAAGVISTTSVLAATAGASVGAVGTYAFLRLFTQATGNEGEAVAGSLLRYGNSDGGYRASTPSGTWLRMGVTGYNSAGATNTFAGLLNTVYLRIS